MSVELMQQWHILSLIFFRARGRCVIIVDLLILISVYHLWSNGAESCVQLQLANQLTTAVVCVSMHAGAYFHCFCYVEGPWYTIQARCCFTREMRRTACPATLLTASLSQTRLTLLSSFTTSRCRRHSVIHLQLVTFPSILSVFNSELFFVVYGIITWVQIVLCIQLFKYLCLTRSF